MKGAGKTKFLILFLLSLLFVSCSLLRPPGVRPARELVIASTNDFHAALDHAEALADVIRNLRKRHGEKLLYLDAGDQFQGSLEGNMSKGHSIVEFFNLVKLDAAAIGNHDLDYGPDVPHRMTVLPDEDGMANLKRRVKEAKYPWLSANLIVDPSESCAPGPRCNGRGQRTVFEPRVTLMRAGRRVCIIGGTTPTTKNITNPDFIRGTRFEPFETILDAELRYFRRRGNCDAIVFLVHDGLQYSTGGKYKKEGFYETIRSLPPRSLSAVIGGHHHINVQQVINDIPILQTGSRAKSVGLLHLIFSNGRLHHRFGPLIPVPGKAEQADVTALLKPYREKAKQYKMQVVGQAEEDFPLVKSEESALGNLIADAVLDAGKEQGKADFSLMNAGGTRNSLPKGDITYGHVFNIMPFDNSLVTVELTGTELLRVLEVSFSGANGVPSVAGLHVKTRHFSSSDGFPERDLNGDGKKEDWERNLLVGARDASGKPIRNEAIYRLATNSYLAQGGDYLDVVFGKLPEGKLHIYEGVLIRDILADYFRKVGRVHPNDFLSETKPRVRFVEEGHDKKERAEKAEAKVKG